MSFAEDLERGREVERKVLDIIQRKYPCACIIDGFKGYDIWIPELHKSVEVKYDPMSNQTGNMFIEIEYGGNISALLTTSADFWIFYDDKDFMLFKPIEIIECIFMNRLVMCEFVGKGNSKYKKGFLIKKDLFFKYGKKYEDNNKDSM